jgi:hypothetical protein
MMAKMISVHARKARVVFSIVVLGLLIGAMVTRTGREIPALFDVGSISSPKSPPLLRSIPRKQSLDSKGSSKTMLVMSDSRSLNDDDYHRLAYAINVEYANRHSYGIRFVHTPCLTPTNESSNKECIACVHAQYGGRAPPWCKLLAINETMHHYSDQFDRIVYLDSDAFVNRLDHPLKETYFSKALNMFWNHPYWGVCSGIQFWQNTRDGREMIDAWWNSNTSFNTIHDYEQSVFRYNTTIMEYVSSIGVIKENVRENRVELGGQAFFRHITRKKDNSRAMRMKTFMERNNISWSVLARLQSID